MLPTTDASTLTEAIARALGSPLVWMSKLLMFQINNAFTIKIIIKKNSFPRKNAILALES